MGFELPLAVVVSAFLGCTFRLFSTRRGVLIGLLVGLSLALWLSFYLTATPLTLRSVSPQLGLSLGAAMLGFFAPDIWRKIIAPNILSLLGWGLLGWVLIHPTLLMYLVGLVWQYRWVTDTVFNFAHWTGEPTAANILIFLGVGICFSIVRNMGNRWFGRMLGGNC